MNTGESSNRKIRPTYKIFQISKIWLTCFLVYLIPSCENPNYTDYEEPKYNKQEEKKVNPDVSDYSIGLPNNHGTCFLNAVFQILAKLYGNVFTGKSALAKAGNKIQTEINSGKKVLIDEMTTFFNLCKSDAGWDLKLGEGGDPTLYFKCLAKHLLFKTPESSYIASCSKCKQAYNLKSDDPFVSIIANSKDPISIDTCFDYVETQLKCTNCDISLNFKVVLKNLPDIIPIRIGKTRQEEHIPVRNYQTLTIKSKWKESDNSDTEYKLVGFIWAGKSKNEWHAKSYIRINNTERWMCYDDERVTEVTKLEVYDLIEKGMAYFLFYQKK